MIGRSVVGIALLGVVLALISCGGSDSGSGTNANARISTDINPDLPTNVDPVIPPNDSPNIPPDISPPVGCNEIGSRCFDIGNAQITKYKDSKKAAASYTFDDGYASSFKIAAIFEKLGLRVSFYINPGNVLSDKWPNWKELAKKGHEIGNHSMTHADFLDPALTDAQMDVEVNGAQRLIEQKIGIRPLVFAFPWHGYNERSLKVVMQHHFAIRDPDVGDDTYKLAFFDQAHSVASTEALALAETLSNVNAQLSDAVALGGWFVAAGHGVDGDGWSPVTSQFLEDHLTFASKYSPQLWTDTYLNVARYRLCRKLVKPVVTILSANQATIRLTGNFDPALCTAPLTITMPIVELPHGEVRARTAGMDVPVTHARGALLLNLRPGDEATVEIVQAPN
jgi:peptidoglycan/xylan/chitin deacetylase (PgdA/CDA1 family)